MKKGKKKFPRGKAVAAVLGVFGYMMVIASQGPGISNGNMYSVDVTTEKETKKTEAETKDGYTEYKHDETYKYGEDSDYQYYYDEKIDYEKYPQGSTYEEGDFEDYEHTYDDKYFEEDFYESEEYKKAMEDKEKQMEEWEKEHNEYFVKDMETEIEEMDEMLEMAKEMTKAVGEVKDEGVKSAVENLNLLIEKASGVLEQMKDLADEELEPETFDEFWSVLEDIGDAAEEHMKVIMDYFAGHEKEFAALDEDVQEFLTMEEDHEDKKGRKDYDKEFKEIYKEVLDEKTLKKVANFVEDDVMEEVMRKISAQLMEELAPHIGEDAVQEILNKINIFGKKGETLLANSTDVYDEIAKIDFTNASENLKKLSEETKNALIVSELKDRLAAYWERARYALESNDQTTLAEVEKGIAALLEKNEMLSVTGEEAYQFEDVRLAESEWYFEPVIEMKEEGIVSGYKDSSGELTGEFRPENNVTLGEVLKMTVEAAQLKITPVADETAHWAVQAGYFSTAQMLGLEQMLDLSNLNRSATREEVAVIVAAVFGLDTSAEYSGVFPDYNGNFGKYIQAVYESGIFTGDGETGNFNGSASINRAEISKVISSALEAHGSSNIINELEAFSEELEKLD